MFGEGGDRVHILKMDCFQPFFFDVGFSILNPSTRRLSVLKLHLLQQVFRVEVRGQLCLGYLQNLHPSGCVSLSQQSLGEEYTPQRSPV